MHSLQYDRVLWVSLDGSDRNDGSQDRPFRTIQKAVDSATPGTAVFVKAGTYTESVQIGGSTSYRLGGTTADRPFTLVSADGPGKAVIVGDDVAQPVVNIIASHVRVHDFEVVGLKTLVDDHAPIKITALAASDPVRDVVIEGNTISGGGRDGIKAAKVQGLHITGNTFDMYAYENMVDFVTVWDSSVTFNTFKGEANIAIGAKKGSQNIDIANNLIDIKNTIFEGRNFPIIEIGGEGFNQLKYEPLPPKFLGFEARDVRVSENIIVGDHYTSIRFVGAIESLVSGNLIYGRGPIGISSTASKTLEKYGSRNNIIIDNIYRADMTLHVAEPNQARGLVIGRNRAGDEGDTDFLVGADAQASWLIAETRDPFPVPGLYRIVLRAGGTGGETSPEFRVSVDGMVIGTERIERPVSGPFTVSNAANYDDFVFNYFGNTPKSITVEMLSSGRDRATGVNLNLFVDALSVNGVTFDAAYVATVYQANAPTVMLAQRDALYGAGVMRFDNLYLAPDWPGPVAIDEPPGEGVDLQVIDVRVAGTGGTVAPAYELWVDGALVGVGVVEDPASGRLTSIPKAEFQTDHFAFRGAEPEKVVIRFVNDYFDGVVDRNLAVDHIIVNGVKYEAETAAVYTFIGGDRKITSVAGTEYMYRDGDMTFRLVEEAARQQLVVRASGSGTATAAPEFEVRIDGVSLGTRTIVNPSSGVVVGNLSLFRDYVFDFDGLPPREVEIEFLNDGMTDGVNRNMFVDRIELNGVRTESERASSYVYERGDALIIETGTEAMYRNGVMTFFDP